MWKAGMKVASNDIESVVPFQSPRVTGRCVVEFFSNNNSPEIS